MMLLVIQVFGRVSIESWLKLSPPLTNPTAMAVPDPSPRGGGGLHAARWEHAHRARPPLIGAATSSVSKAVRSQLVISLRSPVAGALLAVEVVALQSWSFIISFVGMDVKTKTLLSLIMILISNQLYRIVELSTSISLA
jgi:hypothetical protein